MLTPFFTIDQNDEFVFVDIQISHVRLNAKAVEMTVQEQVFIFSMPPYYLRLRLPYNCVDDERCTASFEGDKVKVKLPKEVVGQEFPDLDLTAKLLARVGEIPQKQENKVLIEEMDIDRDAINDGKDKQEEVDGSQFSWEIPQTMPDQAPIPVHKYGFNDEYSGIIGVSISNGNDINELAEPENTPAGQRIMERLIKENIKFDPEYYAADYMMKESGPEADEKDFAGLMQWKSPTTVQFLKWYKSQQAKPKEEQESYVPVLFTEEEQARMMDLPKKTYLVSPEHKQELLLLVVALLFAYHFDLRETDKDHTVESAWTVGRLVPQFACLDSKIAVANELNNDNALKAVVLTCFRRSLCYPLHRNYDLSAKVWSDVYYNLRGGKRMVLKSLLDVKELFRFHDVYYVYDQIWMKDLCSWILNDVSDATFRVLAHDLKRETDAITKELVVFEKVDPDWQEPDSDDDDEAGEADGDEMVALSVAEIEQMVRDGAVA